MPKLQIFLNGTPCAGFDKGLLVTDDLDFKPPAWDAIMAMVERREQSSKNVPNCPKCGTEQVQLVHWQTSNLRYKCRHCKHRFDREENDKA